MIKTCEICSKKFNFNEEEYILANSDDCLLSGHYTAIFPECCQRCNTLITHLDAACSFSNSNAAKEIIGNFEKFSDSPKETVQFVNYCTKHFKY